VKFLATPAELYVLLDALRGSLRIADGGNVFGFTIETRKATFAALLSRMDQAAVEIVIPSELAGEKEEKP